MNQNKRETDPALVIFGENPELLLFVTWTPYLLNFKIHYLLQTKDFVIHFTKCLFIFECRLRAENPPIIVASLII